VFATLQSSRGGAYVNDFNRFGRLYRVFAQAESDFRQTPGDIGRFHVRSATTGAMVPLSTLVTVNAAAGAEMTTRYNLFRSVEITGRAAPGSVPAIASYTDVLDAQRFLFGAQLSAVQTQNALLAATTRLYKALGGGWEIFSDPVAEAP
jgi:multidrug efflux pump subunit AcrB